MDTACDGLEGVRKIRRGCYDIALIDYHMPEIDGLAVANLVHDMLAEATRPQLVAFTATPDLLLAADETSGIIFDEVLSKSSDAPTLVGLVDRLLRSSPNPYTRQAALCTPLAPLDENLSDDWLLQDAAD